MTASDRSLALLLLGLLPACAQPGELVDQVAAPMELSGSAYQAAARIELPEVPPAEGPGLHHVFELSENILSGAEPDGPEALEEIARWGVKTILSVDGKAPDAETAEALGMRYVHVPIEYSGIRADELLKISKTFRELEGPFYVHCYHGKHRGPAAAAVGRVVLDGVPRERAIAEMRQWCSTASKYEGLYSTVATAHIPTAAESAAFDFGFDSAHSFDGLRGAMIDMTRKWDLIKAAKKRGWQPDAEHPDVVPGEEAIQLHQLFEACAQLESTRAWPDDFRAWLEGGRAGAEELARALEDLRSGPVEAAAESPELGEAVALADAAFTRVKESCGSCHAAYRD